MIIQQTYRSYALLFLGLIFVNFTSSCGNRKKVGKEEIPLAQNPSPNNSDLIYKNNFYEALRLKTVGDFQESQKILEWCITERPNDDAVLFLLSTYAESNLKFSKAKEYIDRACLIDPKNIWYVELKAKIQITLDDIVGAEQSYAQMVAHDPYNREWLYYYSEILIFGAKYDKALEILNRLINEIGPIPELIFQRNALYLELNLPEEMTASLILLIEQNPENPDFSSMLVQYFIENNRLSEVEDILNKMLTQNPENASLHVGMADVYFAKGNKIASYQELLKAFLIGTLNADKSVNVLLSIIESEREIPKEVIDLALLLQNQHPENFMTHAILGDIYKRQGNDKEAVKEYAKSLEIKKDNYQLWLEVVAMNYSLYDYKNALKYAEFALNLFPSQPQIYYYAGMSALHLKSYGDANAYIDAGKDYIGRDRLMQAQFELALAEIQFSQNKVPQGRKYLEISESLAPESKLMMNNRAYVLAKYKLDLEKALLLINTALDGNESEAIFLDTKAWVHFARKEYDLALENVKKAFELAPANADINEHYGDILFKLGKADEALYYWKKAAELGKSNEALLQKIQTKKLNE